MAELTSWYSEGWQDLRVVVLGLGASGFAAADTLCELGSRVTVVDSAPDDDRAKLLGVIGADLVVAERDETPAVLADAELAIVNPALPPHHPWVVAIRERGIPVWGDIELAWRVRDKVQAADWLLVTGTNGKTTTVQLAAHMLREGGFRVAPVGNIGTPVLDAVRDPEGFDVLVVELSSFQLHTLGEIWPHSAVCLNLADDHLDWHGAQEAYRDAKAKVYRNVAHACVYNLADIATMRMVVEADVVEGARAIGFGLGTPDISDFGIVDGYLIDRAFLEERRTNALEIGTVADLVEAGLASAHMAENVLAAAALARAYGTEPAAIQRAIRGFRADKHRTERIGEIDGVLYVDDSKATNPHAAAGSLAAFDSVVWIVGGLLKGVDIAPLVREHAGRLKAAVVIGEDQTPVLEALERHAPQVPVHPIAPGDTDTVMQRAVAQAAALATAGDTVLLAPAAASMDQFASYADRGDRFALAVEQLAAAGRAANDDDASGAPSAAD